MPMFATRFVIAGAEEEVSPARRKVVETVQAWGVPLDDEVAHALRLVASELITNAVIHATGPVTIALHHRPGRLMLVVADHNPQAPVAGCAADGDESGRGLALVDHFAVRSGWKAFEHGKSVWAEIELPKPPPPVRASVLRRFFAGRARRETGPTPQALALSAA
ncbi:ATP-binding protein [Streptomyces sp. NPDC051776]|uniref:ATP-binding protein n=1 Tax=Streptomyces sp. NPDC051776 TaxID=3155414 RepID=UPI00342C01E6